MADSRFSLRVRRRITLMLAVFPVYLRICLHPQLHKFIVLFLFFAG